MARLELNVRGLRRWHTRSRHSRSVPDSRRLTTASTSSADHEPKGEEMRRFTSKSTGQLEDEVAQLTALVEEMKGRLERLEGGTSDAENGDGNARSRRDLLKLAGARAVRAGGALVHGGSAAAAAAATPPLDRATEGTRTTPKRVPTGGAGPAPAFHVAGQ